MKKIILAILAIVMFVVIFSPVNFMDENISPIWTCLLIVGVIAKFVYAFNLFATDLPAIVKGAIIFFVFYANSLAPVIAIIADAIMVIAVLAYSPVEFDNTVYDKVDEIEETTIEI